MITIDKIYVRILSKLLPLISVYYSLNLSPFLPYINSTFLIQNMNYVTDKENKTDLLKNAGSYANIRRGKHTCRVRRAIDTHPQRPPRRELS